MNVQEVEKLLQKISNQKMFGETEKAIANLHILHHEFPQEKKYLALLASSYLDGDSTDTAEEYSDRALAIDPHYPEAFELKGMIAEKKGDDVRAEKYYKESVSQQIPFKTGHLRLVLLYYRQERYDETIKEGEYLLNNFDQGRNTYSADEQRKIFAQWLSLAYNRLYSALIRTNRYSEAVDRINDYVSFRKNYVSDPYQFLSEDEVLLKLYYTLHDVEKIKEFEDRMLTFYMVPESIVDSMKKDAEQGYLESANPENYTV